MSQWLTAELQARLHSGAPVVGVGLISGTSADGIDAAAVRLWREGERLRWEQLAFRSEPYPADLREGLFRCFSNVATVREVCLLNAHAGELFADAAEAVAREAGGCDFAASHGQTLWHEPDAPFPATLQVGESARIAARLGTPVVADFRQQDLALGGQGAPLVPYVDHLLFSDPHESRAIQNLGGIGNVTYLRAGGDAASIVAFDTGPANALIDAAARLVTHGAQTCDVDGRLAAQGTVDAEHLARLLAEPYYAAPPPKSTGRELFSDEIVRTLWDGGLQGPDLLATLTELTVQSIARAYRDWLGPVDRVLLGGGGARNAELVRRLSAALAPAIVADASGFGCEADAKEAVAFAVMGYQTLRGEPSNVPAATGAGQPTVQGKLCVAGSRRAGKAGSDGTGK